MSVRWKRKKLAIVWNPIFHQSASLGVKKISIDRTKFAPKDDTRRAAPFRCVLHGIYVSQKENTERQRE